MEHYGNNRNADTDKGGLLLGVYESTPRFKGFPIRVNNPGLEPIRLHLHAPECEKPRTGFADVEIPYRPHTTQCRST